MNFKLISRIRTILLVISIYKAVFLRVLDFNKTNDILRV